MLPLLRVLALQAIAALATQEECDQAIFIQRGRSFAEALLNESRSQAKALKVPLKCDKDTGGTCSVTACDDSRGPTECKKNGLLSYSCLCLEGYCAVGGQCRYSAGLPPLPLPSPGSHSSSAFFVKCWYGNSEQQAEITSGGAVASWDEFTWAKDGGYQKKHILITGEYEDLSGVLKVTGWNLDGEPSADALALKCQETLDTQPLAEEQKPFLYGITSGAPNCTSETECQGSFYEVPGWGPLYGPMLTFQDLKDSHVRAGSHVKTWVTFGDSLSDVGNFMWYSFKFPMSPYYFGHFSNGWVWQEHMATALYRSYEAKTNGIINPPTGFMSYARGGSVTNELLANGALTEYFKEKLDVTAFEHVQVGVTGVLTGDLWNSLYSADEWARTNGDPYSITTDETCSKHGAKCNDSGPATCVGTRCLLPANATGCKLFTCTCDEGYYNRGGTCKAATPQAMAGPGPLGFVWQGANDLMAPAGLSSVNEYFSDNTTGFLGYKAVVRDGVLNIVMLMDALYRRGYRSFAVPNMPNLGAIPMNIVRPNVINAAFAPGGNVKASDDEKLIRGAQEMTKVVKAWNVAIKAKLDEWASKNVQATLVQFDFYAWLDKVLSNNPYGQNLSFNETVTAGDETMTIQKRCMSTSIIPVTQVGWLGPGDVCPDQEGVVFWDNCHPTTRSQCYMASFFHEELAKSGLFPAPDMEKYKVMCNRDDIAWNGHSIHTGPYEAASFWETTMKTVETILDPQAWQAAFKAVTDYIKGTVADPSKVFEYAQGFVDTVIMVVQDLLPGQTGSGN